MAEVKPRDPNRGPISLEHDIRPRDLEVYNPHVDALAGQNDHRYQGYPEGYMMNPRNPLRGSQEGGEALRGRGASQSFSQLQYGSLKPGSDEGKVGFQYGSDLAYDPRRGIRDPYHSLSSAEVSKIRQQKEMADEDIMRFRSERLRQTHADKEEQARDLNMLKDYNPWGKPGAGAPRWDTQEQKLALKKEKFTEESLGLDRKPPEQDFPFGKPGGGAPRVDPTGHVNTIIPGSKDIRFRENPAPRHAVENQMRYMQEEGAGREYLKDLDRQIAEKATKETDVRVQDLQAEMRTLQHDPYGRPGAGARNLPTDRQKLWEEPKASYGGPTKGGAGYDPWGKGFGGPERDAWGNVRRHKNTDRDLGPHTDLRGDAKYFGSSIELGNEIGGGAPNRTDSGHVRTRQQITMKKDDYGKASIREEAYESPRRSKNHRIYDPFGRPGAGAPLRDIDGGVITHVHGRMKEEIDGQGKVFMSAESRDVDKGEIQRKHVAAKLYLEELQKEMKEQKENKENFDNYMRAPIGEFASIVKDGQVGKPKYDPVTGVYSSKQHNPSSDVTRMRTDERRQKNQGSKLYHDTLQQAADERAHIRDLEKQRDTHEANQHTMAFTDYWGKPGHGAPTEDIHKKPLDAILHDPRNVDVKYKNYAQPGVASEGNYLDYAKAPRESISEGGQAFPNSPRGNFVRQTIPSDHRNLFELEQGRKMNRRSYNLPVPYATE